ncbi:hypothetical protein HDV00_001827 [Rhizophlyctis rosea]|nr:hypothetical protein HDV00_001827 [Rhizophlyctis rosea]
MSEHAPLLSTTPSSGRSRRLSTIDTLATQTLLAPFTRNTNISTDVDDETDNGRAISGDTYVGAPSSVQASVQDHKGTSPATSYGSTSGSHQEGNGGSRGSGFACPELGAEANEGAARDKRKLIIATSLCFAFFILELVAGIISGSLAILSDSFHLLSDIAGFAISLAALYLSQQPATKRHSYGFYRAEIIGAILSVFLIWILTAFLLWEAVERVRRPTPIDGRIMAGTAAIGVVVNIVLGLTLHGGHDHSSHLHGHSHSHSHKDDHDHDHDHDHHHGDDHDHEHHHEEEDEHVGRSIDDLIEAGLAGSDRQRNKMPKKRKHQNINITSAAIHVLGDLLSSVGVLIAAITIWIRPDLTIVDPICTFIFSVFVLATTIRLMYNSLTVLMEATPSDIDPHAVEKDLHCIPGVRDVHDLHIWNLTIGKPSLSVHITIHRVDPTTSAELIVQDYHRILAAAQELVCSRYGIHHATVQLEGEGFVDEDSASEGSVNGIASAHCNPNMCRLG